MKRNGFTVIETLVVIALMITLASVLVLGYYGLRDVTAKNNAALKLAEERLQVVSAWERLGVYNEAQAVEEMRRRQPTGDLPAWDTAEAAELVGLEWRVRP
jgi:type II secretory pathway pseudopilin PulG